MALSSSLYLEYLSLTLLFVLVGLTLYGAVRARVRYYKVGMSLLFLGFVLVLLDGVDRVFGLPVQLAYPSLWVGGNLVLIIGVFTLTIYRGRLGL